MKKVAVYGGGVSGLITAFNLIEKNMDVTLVDPFDEPLLKTIQTSNGPVELAAGSLLLNSDVKYLLQKINLKSLPYSDEGKKKYVFIGGKVQRWPLSFFETLFSFRALYGLAKRKVRMFPKKGEDLASWGQRCLPKPLFEKLIIMGLQGVYGTDVGSLSASLVLSSIFDKKKQRSLGSVSFKNGMSELTDGLTGFLKEKGVKFIKETDHKLYDFKVICSPAHSLPAFLNLKTKDLLSKVEYKKVSSMTLFFKEKDRVHFKGFGCVFKDQPGILGLVLNSDLFEGRAREGFYSETWILDGKILDNEQKALEKVLFFRRDKLCTEATPQESHFKFWENGIPNYNIDLENIVDKLNDLDGGKEKAYFFANWTGALGIGSMVQSSKVFIERVLLKEGAS